MPKITKEQFLHWCRATIEFYDQTLEGVNQRTEALGEWDPELARLEREGLAAATRTINYIKRRMGGNN